MLPVRNQNSGGFVPVSVHPVIYAHHHEETHSYWMVLNSGENFRLISAVQLHQMISERSFIGTCNRANRVHEFHKCKKMFKKTNKGIHQIEGYTNEKNAEEHSCKNH